MSTNSMIFKLSEDKKQVQGIYCHWNGYINGVGYVLQTFYQDAKKVEKLITLGNISSLGKYVEASEAVQKFGFYPATSEEFLKLDPAKQNRLLAEEPYYTVAYHRDRGEAKHFMEMTYNEFQDCLEKDSFQYSGPEYIYLLVPTKSGHKWLVSSYSKVFDVWGYLQDLSVEINETK